MPWRRWVAAALSSWTLLAVNVLVAFVTTPLLINALGRSGFGWWASLGAAAMLLSLLEGGLGGAATRFIAAAKSPSLRARLTTTVRVWSLRYAGAAAAVAVLLTPAAPLMIRGGEVSPADSRLAFLLVALSVAVGVSAAGAIGVLQAHERWVLRNVLQIARQLIWLGMVVGVTLAELDVPHLAAGLLILASAYAVVANRLSAAICRPKPPSEPAAPLLRYGAARTATQMVDHVVYAGPTLLASGLIGPSAAAAVGLAIRLQEMARQGVLAISQLYLPRAARIGSEDSTRLRQNLGRGLMLFSWLTTPPMLLLLLAGERFLTLWVGADLGHDVGGVLPVVLIPLWVYLIQVTTVETFYAVGRPDLRLKLQGAGAALLLLAAPFAARASGFLGILVCQCVAIGVVDGILLPLVTFRVIGLPERTWFFRTVAVLSLSSLTSVPGILAFCRRADTLAAFLAGGALSAGLAYALVWILVVRPALARVPDNGSVPCVDAEGE